MHIPINAETLAPFIGGTADTTMGRRELKVGISYIKSEGQSLHIFPRWCAVLDAGIWKRLHDLRPLSFVLPTQDSFVMVAAPGGKREIFLHPHPYKIQLTPPLKSGPITFERACGLSGTSDPPP